MLTAKIRSVSSVRSQCLSLFAAYISASDLHENLCKIQNQLLRLEMETASVTRSLLADLSKSEGLYDAQKFVHIVDAFITDWSLRCCPLISICSWLSFQSRRAIFLYSCGLLDSLNTTE